MAPEYENKELTINPTQVFSVHNLTLKPNQPEEPPFINHVKAIYNLVVHVDSKASKYLSPTEEVPQGKKPGARSRLKRKQSLKHTSESTIKASKSQSSHLKKETKSSSAMDASLSHHSPPTPVVGEMHTEAQQAAGGPTSLGDTSKDGAHSQDMMLQQISQLKLIIEYLLLRIPYHNNRLEDLADILKDTRSAFFTPDSPTDEPIIISDVYLLQSHKKELEQAKVKAKAKIASMKAKPSYPNINLLTELLIIQWELPAEFLDLPHLASSIQEKLKTLDSLPGLLKMVINILNRFTTLVANASEATTTGVPSADKATASPAGGGEKNADTNLKNELVDLFGIDIVTH
nr:hypothetical protein [Tanacetum cinerariifolium]